MVQITHTFFRSPPITNYQLPITNYQLPITNYQLPITNYQLPITNYQLPITNLICFYGRRKYPSASNLLITLSATFLPYV